MKTFEQIKHLLESCDWQIASTSKHNGETCNELESYSPEGEDLIVTIWHDGTPAGFIKAFQEYAEDFDADEHAEMWIESRGKNGVPESIRDLLNDADWIKNNLIETARILAD